MANKYGYEELQGIGGGSKEYIAKDGQGNVIGANRKQFGYYHPERGTYSILTKRHYVRQFKTIKLSDVITNVTDIGRVTILRENIKEDNMIMYTTGDKKASIPATKKSMCQMIDLSYKRGKEFIDRMIDIGVISEWIETKTGVERYYLNPLYGMIGTEINTTVYSMFKEQLLPYLEEAAKEDLDKLLWIESHTEEYEALRREYEAKQMLIEEEKRQATEAFINDEEDFLEEAFNRKGTDTDNCKVTLEEEIEDIKESSSTICDKDTLKQGYKLIRESMTVFKECFGIKAKLHMTQETATVDRVNACKSAIDFFCSKSQNKAMVTVLSGGLITIED